MDILSNPTPNITPAPAYGDPGEPSAPPPVAAPAAAPEPGVWHRVVTGALQGLLGGGVAGAIKGAVGDISPAVYEQRQQAIQTKQQQAQANLQETQSNIKFRDAQSALLVTQAHAADLHLHALPQELQDDANSRSLSQMQGLQTLGISPTLVAPNHGDGATAGLQQLTDSHGAVPHLFTVNTGAQLVAYDLSALAQSPNILSEINKVRSIQAPDQEPIDQGTWQKLPAQTKEQLIHGALTFGTDVPTKENAGSLLQQAQNNAATYAERSSPDPAIQKQLDSRVSQLKKASEYFDSHEVAQKAAIAQGEVPAKLQVAQAEAKMKATRQDNDPVVAVDPQQGNVVTTRAQAEEAGQFHYKADPAKINAVVAGMNDVQTKLNQLADVVKDPSFGQVQGPLAAALLDSKGIAVSALGFSVGDWKRYSANTYAGNLAVATPATRNYVTAILAAHEAITQLPRLQTFGQSSRMTQQQMEAAQAMLPVPGDDPKMAVQKMSSLQGTIDPLRKQIPKMPGAPLLPSFLER